MIFAIIVYANGVGLIAFGYFVVKIILSAIQIGIVYANNNKLEYDVNPYVLMAWAVIDTYVLWLLINSKW